MLGGIPLLNLFLGNLPGCQITDIFTYFALEHEDALGETDPADDIFKEWPHVSSAVRDSEAGDSPLGGGHYGLAGGGDSCGTCRAELQELLGLCGLPQSEHLLKYPGLTGEGMLAWEQGRNTQAELYPFFFSP